MGLTAIVSSSASSASSASVTSLTSPVGVGIGGLFVAVALILLLAYLDLLKASKWDTPELRRTLMVTVIPLIIAFAGVVVFKALVVL